MSPAPQRWAGRPAVQRFALDLGWVLAGAWLSSVLTGQNPVFWRMHLAQGALVTICGGLFLRFLEFHRMRRFPSAAGEWRLVARLGLGVFGASTLIALALRNNISAAYGLLTAALALCGLLGERFARYRPEATAAPSTSGGGQRVLVIGAGAAAEMLVQDMRRSHPHAEIAGLLDDDPQKIGSTVLGIPVLGRIEQLGELVQAHQPTEVVIAIPSLDRAGQIRILGLCKGLNAKIRMMPAISRQLAEAGHGLPQLRDVAPEELLRRDAIETDMSGATGYIEGKTVLITGGGGSIGSELARQVSSLRPAKLILLGKGENSIFEVEQEFRDTGVADVVPIIAGVRDAQAIGRIMAEHKPDVVFHAAAHKHVPLMERVPIEAVRNNVLGTLTVAQAAMAHGVKKFILISTDKAVNPTNVMGATKRVAEMVVMALSGRSDTQFAAVRFGNVLGSRGSLIPILKKQIAKGGPITVTDERMTRFFMTIPEAAQLVVQAGSHGGAGEIFILDMGEPVKIVDVARGLIRLYGLEEGKDIDLVFIGARPGEKIHEELSWESEDLERLDGGKILRLKSPGMTDWESLEPQIADLLALCDSGDQEAVRKALMALVAGDRTISR